MSHRLQVSREKPLLMSALIAITPLINAITFKKLTQTKDCGSVINFQNVLGRLQSRQCQVSLCQLGKRFSNVH